MTMKGSLRTFTKEEAPTLVNIFEMSEREDDHPELKLSLYNIPVKEIIFPVLVELL